ncbi:MAG: HD domain-containing protein [Oscillospiraceae bacterium]|nr:HD domain-containing protein [Oscillospiraceae bacterium]
MTQSLYYALFFALSFALTLLYAAQWHKHFDVHMTAIFLLIPVMSLLYWLLYAGHDQETAIAAMKVIYVGSCFLPWLTTMCVASLCGVRVGRPIRLISLLLNTLIYLSVLTVPDYPLFYRSIELVQVGGAWALTKTYGPFHTAYNACIILYLLADMAIIFHGYRKKKQVSRRVLFLLFIPIPVSIAGYFANHLFLGSGYEIIPINYMLAQVVYLLIVRRMVLYNVSEMVAEAEVQSGNTGFITTDSKERYLGSNETAKAILPELRLLRVDRPVTDREELKDTVCAWLERYRKDPKDGRFLYARQDPDGGGERIYTVAVGELYDGRRRCGWRIFLEDDTQNQKYIRLLDQYNADLQAEVDAKTERLEIMHDKLILGMAAMVESRDNSTGGHIRRTSEGVRLLTEAIRETGTMELTDAFCKKLVKAAPMHDLGKIAVDDAVLRKPGRFTPEERAEMQKHAAEGARIVRSILQDTDDEEFLRIAENVAHYHHERVDGSGYPEGLKGDGIPVEARIMAVADVYDALVSKRVYKEKFSFEDADRIVLEGMGTQFDARLQPCYEAARPRLEAYYAAESRKEGGLS